MESSVLKVNLMLNSMTRKGVSRLYGRSFSMKKKASGKRSLSEKQNRVKANWKENSTKEKNGDSTDRKVSIVN